MPEPSPLPTAPRRLTWAIVGVVSLWCVYLAVGATGYFSDRGLFDLRRSVVVLICSATFLGGWAWLLERRPAIARGSESSAAAAVTPWNRASLASVIVNLTGWALWGVAVAVAGQQANLVLGWTAVGAFGVSSILALIGLSNPRPARGQLLGLVTLLLLACVFVAFIAHARQQAEATTFHTSLDPINAAKGMD